MSYKKVKICPVSILPFWMVNCFLIITSKSCILFDSWLPWTEKKIEKVLNQNGLSYKDIDLIVVSHAHIDHAWNANLLKKLSWAEILAHKWDLVYLQGKKKMTFCDTRLFSKFFRNLWLIQKKFEYFTPDIILDWFEKYSLKEYGLDAYIVYTPWHTEGSISLLINNSEAIVWDLISSWILLWGIILKNTPIRPPFEDDPVEVSNSLENLINEWYTNFYMWHWWPLTNKEVELHIKNLRKIK